MRELDEMNERDKTRENKQEVKGAETEKDEREREREREMR